jgi:7-cyano-7-deazaguanine synthase
LTAVTILLSGGLDSLACVAHYRKAGLNPCALFVDYGQPAGEREWASARTLSARLQFPLDIIRTIGISIPQGLIVGRNAFLLTVGLMHLRGRAGLIALGIHSGTDYADCTPVFLNRMQELFDLYTGGQIRIDAPFLQWTKPDIWEFLKQQEYPIEATYSCESGVDPCGACLSCMDLRRLHAR